MGFSVTAWPTWLRLAQKKKKRFSEKLFYKMWLLVNYSRLDPLLREGQGGKKRWRIIGCTFTSYHKTICKICVPGLRRKQPPPSPTGTSKVVFWLHQGNVQVVQSLQEGQALGLQRGSWEVQDWQSEEKSPVIFTTTVQTKECLLELENIRCCFLAGQESPTSTWALETVWANNVMNKERHAGEKWETWFSL